MLFSSGWFFIFSFEFYLVLGPLVLDILFQRLDKPNEIHYNLPGSSQCNT